MAKRESGFGNMRYSETEEIFLRQCACILDITNAQLIRKCVALGLPQLLGNPFLRRVELDDAMKGLNESVNFLWSKRDAR